MKYNDSIISSPEDFAKMAKEYSAKLKREENSHEIFHNIDVALLDDINYSISFINWLYSYIKRNVRSKKLYSIFESLEKQTGLDMSDLRTQFELEKTEKITKPRRLNNLYSCVRLALHSEAEFLQKLLLVPSFENYEFLIQIINEHLDFIKQLSII